MSNQKRFPCMATEFELDLCFIQTVSDNLYLASLQFIRVPFIDPNPRLGFRTMLVTSLFVFWSDTCRHVGSWWRVYLPCWVQPCQAVVLCCLPVASSTLLIPCPRGRSTQRDASLGESVKWTQSYNEFHSVPLHNLHCDMRHMLNMHAGHYVSMGSFVTIHGFQPPKKGTKILQKGTCWETWKMICFHISKI